MELPYASTSTPTSKWRKAASASAVIQRFLEGEPRHSPHYAVPLKSEKYHKLSDFWSKILAKRFSDILLQADIKGECFFSLKHQTLSYDKGMIILFRCSESISQSSRDVVQDEVKKISNESGREPLSIVFIEGQENTDKQMIDEQAAWVRISRRSQQSVDEESLSLKLDGQPLAIKFPHQRRFDQKVGMGSSIGLASCPHVSATAGGYVNINGRMYMLTANNTSNTCACSNVPEVQSPLIIDAKWVHQQSVKKLHELTTRTKLSYREDISLGETGILTGSLDDEIKQYSTVISGSKTSEQNLKTSNLSRERQRSGIGRSIRKKFHNPQSSLDHDIMNWSLTEITPKHCEDENYHRHARVRIPIVHELQWEKMIPEILKMFWKSNARVTGIKWMCGVVSRGPYAGQIDLALDLSENSTAISFAGDSCPLVIGDDAEPLGPSWSWANRYWFSANRYWFWNLAADRFAEIAESMDVDCDAITLPVYSDYPMRSSMNSHPLQIFQLNQTHGEYAIVKGQAEAWDSDAMKQGSKPGFQAELPDTISKTGAQSQIGKRRQKYDETSTIDELTSSRRKKKIKGCSLCYIRNTRCDEGRPVCGSCIKLFQRLSCYDQPVIFRHLIGNSSNQSADASIRSIIQDRDEYLVDSLDDVTSDGSIDDASSKTEYRKGLQSSISTVTYSTQPTTARDSRCLKALQAGPKTLHYLVEDEHDDDQFTVSDDSDILLTSETCELIIETFAEALNETLPENCRLLYPQSVGKSAFLDSVGNLLKNYCVKVMHDNPGHFRTRQAAKAIRRLRNEISLNVQATLEKHSNPKGERKQDISILNLLDTDESKEPTGSKKSSDWLRYSETNDELSHPPETWQGFESEDEVEFLAFSPEDQSVYEYLIGHDAFHTLEKDLNVCVERYFGDQMGLISLRLLRTLRQPQFVGASTDGILSASLVTSWNPVRFLEDQYPNGRLQRLRDVFVITGGSECAQMCTVEQYLRRNWKNHTFELVDHLTYVISAGAQGLLSSNISYSMETQTIMVRGPEDLVVTVGQQLAWLGAACCFPSGKLAVCYTTFSEKEVPENKYPTFCVSHEVSSSGVENSSSCWHDLVGDSVIAYGFPIPDRADEMLGLQLPVELMAVLGSIPFATYFDGGYILKGRSFMIVPLQRKGTSVQWHLFQSKDNDRIKYEDLSELAPNRLLVEKSDGPAFLSTESFLGWCPQCKVNLATKEYKYTETKYSQSASKPKLTLSADSFMIGFQQWGAASVNLTLGRNQGFYRNGISEFYSDILRDSANMLVVLYDTEARRAWQTDAETMILHTILDRHERNFFDHSNTSICLERADCDNPGSVRKAMWSNCNVPVEPDKHLTEAKVNVKQFFHIVSELYHLFDGLQATQRQISKKNAIQVNGSQGCQVHGWEYLDIVRHKTELELRHEQLKPSCGEWPELMRQLNAVVLYGSFFQDVFEPYHSTGMCLELQKMPRDKDYLAMQVSTLNRLYYESGTSNDDHDLARITPKGTKLCPSKHLFDPCPGCAGGTTSASNNDCCIRNWIQYLDFKSDKRMTKLPGLGDTGAIIIGEKPDTSIIRKIFPKSKPKSNNTHSHVQAILSASFRKNQSRALGVNTVSWSSTVSPLSSSQPAPVLSHPLPTTQPQIQQTPLLYQHPSTSQQVP